VTFRTLLAREWAAHGDLSEQQLSALEQHYELLCRWNRRTNLTRINDLEDAVRLHYCESLFLGRSLPRRGLSIADIGSGAGFPGIPVAVLCPECSVTLIESNTRKAVFLREASKGLANVSVLQGRAESVASCFEVALSRAVEASAILALGLAPHVAILTTRSELARLESQPPGTEILVPWGKQRVIATFHVEHLNRPHRSP
jgi:16S rRNA (guanine527-N7)-methyltransferase